MECQAMRNDIHEYPLPMMQQTEGAGSAGRSPVHNFHVLENALSPISRLLLLFAALHLASQ